MDYRTKIENYFYESIDTETKAVETLPELIETSSLLMAECLTSDGKILSCGNGGSATIAQHFVASLVNKFVIDRPPLAAIALSADTSTITSISNDFSYNKVFSKQIYALGDQDDILLAISASGNSENIIRAITTAHEKDMRVIALTGSDGGQIKDILENGDIEIRVPSNVTARIQEAHMLIIHSICAIIDTELFGEF